MNWLKISGISGIIAPPIAFALTMLAIAYSPSFSWTENALSDLGVQEGVTAVLFNTGLITSGVLAVFFATGLFKFLQKNALGGIGAFVFVVDAFALTAIGVFPENVKPIHFYASVAFFVLFPISMFFLGAAFLRMHRMKLGFFTFIVAIFAAIVWTIPFGEGVAIPETLSALSASAWSIVLGFKMVKEGIQTINVRFRGR
ncbi:DUF998 domain-containing protein [Candidatus Bathyarchaeota archaeon]|nr:DUF998 domain-containing protein [Candidatus Bathyarchaeota archaeon]